MFMAGTIAEALLGAMIGGLILAAEDKTLEITPQMQRRFWRGFVICFVLARSGRCFPIIVFNALLALRRI